MAAIVVAVSRSSSAVEVIDPAELDAMRNVPETHGTIPTGRDTAVREGPGSMGPGEREQMQVRNVGGVSEEIALDAEGVGKGRDAHLLIAVRREYLACGGGRTASTGRQRR